MPKRTPTVILRRVAVIVLVLLIVIAGLWLAGRAALLYTYGPNALAMAIDSRDVDQVEHLLKLGADPNKPDAAGMTPLAQVLAPRSRNDSNALEIMQLLLRFGADPNGTTSEGHPFLFEALTKRPPNIAQALLDAGADPNIQLPDGESVLAYLIRNPYVRNLGNADRVRMLIDAGAEVGLWETILLADFERFETIVDNDPSAVRRPLLRGATALHAAASAADAKIVRYLLDSGADPNVQNDDGATPLHAALNPRYVSGKPLASREQVARLLLERGAQPGLADDAANTPLHVAARYGVASMVKQLLEADADPLRQNISGHTPIALVWPYYDSQDGSADYASALDSILKMLVEAGSLMNVKGSSRCTPLSVAARWASSDTFELMLDHGADPNFAPSRSTSPLHVAHFENARILLERGAKVDIRDPDGKTPLMRALRRGEPAKVELLLEWGANVHIQSRSGGLSISDTSNLPPGQSPVDAARQIWANPNHHSAQFQEAARLVLEAVGIDPAELE